MENVSIIWDHWKERLLNRQGILFSTNEVPFLFKTNLSFFTTDPRVIDYPFVETDPRPVAAIVLSYLAFVHFGKKFMKNREAFNVPVWVLFIYNCSLVAISAHIVKDVGRISLIHFIKRLLN